jgi:O-antigen ligase
MVQKSKLRASVKPTRDPLMSCLTWGSGLVALSMWAPVQDPFNAPKQWVLLTVGAWLTGHLVTSYKDRLAKEKKAAYLWIGLFILALCLSLIISGASFTTILGDYARRTGALTYLALSAIFLAAVKNFTESNIDRLLKVVLVCGSLIPLYGILQHYGIDIIKWNNPYNSVISTLGNPDFAGAVFGILAVVAFGILIRGSSTPIQRTWSALNLFGCILALYFSKVFQGFINSAIGIGVLVIVAVFNWRKIFGLVLAILGLIIGLFVLAGIFNHGPLRTFLYKSSIPIRGDYWRAGWRMFKSHIWGGVGLDRYGYFFREYRDIVQVNRHGAGVLSNAAHSVPIQLAATGGIFVFLTYLGLTGFILWRGFKGLLNLSGTKQFNLAIVLASWLAFEVQSLVSIDNIGITIWGWILAGAVVALSIAEPTGEESRGNKIQSHKVKHQKTEVKHFLGWVFAILALVLCIPLYLSDSAVKRSQAYKAPTDQAMVTAYTTLAEKSLGYGLVDPAYRVIAGQELASAGNIPEAVNLANAAIEKDSRNYEAITLLAEIYEGTNQKSKAISFRAKLVKLDPLNSGTYLALLKDQHGVGDSASAKATFDQLNALFPGSPDSLEAAKELAAK